MFIREVSRLKRSAAALLAASCATAASSQVNERTWSTVGDGASIVATDCTDCGDDIGLLVTCAEGGKRANVSVYWGAKEEPASDRAMKITIDTLSFDFEAAPVLVGAIGYVPRVTVALDHPLWAALQTGRQAVFAMSSQPVTIALGGADRALSEFKQRCKEG